MIGHDFQVFIAPEDSIPHCPEIAAQRRAGGPATMGAIVANCDTEINFQSERAFNGVVLLNGFTAGFKGVKRIKGSSRRELLPRPPTGRVEKCVRPRSTVQSISPLPNSVFRRHCELWVRRLPSAPGVHTLCLLSLFRHHVIALLYGVIHLRLLF
ncbi:hypothetical protein J6590_055361 [Homalodisca vitripennis]|nr:hypothetical protein J6590_055361 [Homalodisca vitripennis]